MKSFFVEDKNVYTVTRDEVFDVSYTYMIGYSITKKSTSSVYSIPYTSLTIGYSITKKSTTDELTEGFIVYIDEKHDVRWIDTRNGESKKDKEDKQELEGYLAKISILKQKPCKNLSLKDKRTFMKFVGIAYVNALRHDFSEIEKNKEIAKDYVYGKNREIARTLYLQVALMFVLVALLFGVLNFSIWKSVHLGVIVMGIFGAYVSIWMRYGKIQYTGLASKHMYYIESCSRLIVGAISALFAMYVVRLEVFNADLLKTVGLTKCVVPYNYYVVGFFAGFSERFVPTLIEKISNNSGAASKH